MESVYFDDAKHIRKLGFITGLSSMGIFMDGFALSIFSIALLYIEKNILYTPFLVSLGAAAIYIGMFIGSVIFGHLSDLRGRKPIYIFDLAFTSIFMFLTGLSNSFALFFIFQVLAGAGIGADYPISSSIQAEFTPRRVRGRYLVFNMLSWTFGALTFYVLSIPMVLYGGDMAWRFMYIAGAIIPIMVILGRSQIPETPFWLAKEGKYEEATELSKRLTGMDSSAVIVPKVESGKSNLGELLNYIPMLIFSSIAWLSYDVASYGVWNYTPSLFVSSGSYVGSVISTVLEIIPVIVGTIACLLLIDRIGRKRLQSAGFLMAGLSLLIVSIIFLKTGIPFTFLFLSFALMHFFHNIGPTNTTYLYPPEIFPTKIRGTAMGIATASSRVGAILGVFAFPLIVSRISVSSGLIFFSLFEFIGFTVTILMAPETRNQHLR